MQTNKLSTFRLIERCANIISALVNQILHNHAAYGDDLGAGTTDGERTAGFKDDETLLLVQNLEGLKNKLSEVEAFVQRQREKTFLKLCEFSGRQTVLRECWVLSLRDFSPGRPSRTRRRLNCPGTLAGHL